MRYWPSARRTSPDRERIFQALPWIVAASLAAFFVLRVTLLPVVGVMVTVVLATGLPVAVVCGAYRYAVGDQSGRRAALEGAGFAAAVVIVYWLIFILPVPELW